MLKTEVLLKGLTKIYLKEELKLTLWFCHLNKKLCSFFDSYNGLCFCKDFNGLMMELGCENKCDD